MGGIDRREESDKFKGDVVITSSKSLHNTGRSL